MKPNNILKSVMQFSRNLLQTFTQNIFFIKNINMLRVFKLLNLVDTILNMIVGMVDSIGLSIAAYGTGASGASLGIDYERLNIEPCKWQ